MTYVIEICQLKNIAKLARFVSEGSAMKSLNYVS